jgi:XRE family transcriptional regulator, regulator of sulfur utilization
MVKDFDELAARAKAGWSDNATHVYETAASQFTAEVTKRAELGEILAAARKERSLTQPALSEITGVQQSEISRIECGLGNPTATTLLRLADALGQKLTLVPA